MVEAAASKLIIGTPVENSANSSTTVHVLPSQARVLLGLLAPKTLGSVETASDDTRPAMLPSEVCSDEQFWRSAFAALADNGTV